MSTHDRPGPRTLAASVAEVAAGHGDVVAVVMTTFVVDPRFIEREVLMPLLVGKAASNDKVGDVLLAHALESVAGVTVFYELGHLAPRMEAPRHGLRMVGVSHGTGVLHAKHVLALTVKPDGSRALVVLTTSANLTHAGWLRNLELADLDVVEGNGAHGLVPGLQVLMRNLRAMSGAGVDDPALETIGAFLDECSAGHHPIPALWAGGEPLLDFLARHHTQKGGCLELAAPYGDGQAWLIQQIVARLAPGRVVLRTPTDEEGVVSASVSWFAWRGGHRVQVSAGIFDGLETVRVDGQEVSRFVHAKLVRWTPDDGGPGWVLIGSPNFSKGAYAGWDEGNAETAVLRSCPPGSWLLEAGDDRNQEAATEPLQEQEQGPGAAQAPQLRVDWSTQPRGVFIRWSQPCDRRVSIWPGRGTEAEPLWVTQPRTPGVWHALDGADGLVDHAERSGVVFVGDVTDEFLVPVLIEQIAAARRPCLFVRDLDISDILSMWSCPTAARRARRADDLYAPGSDEDPDSDLIVKERTAGKTFFDAYAGILHAFGALEDRLSGAGQTGPQGAAHLMHRLLGDGPTSLGQLAARLTAEMEQGQGARDPVRHIILAMSAAGLLAGHHRHIQNLSAEDSQVARARLGLWDALVDKAWARVVVDDVHADVFRQWFTQHWEVSCE